MVTTYLHPGRDDVIFWRNEAFSLTIILVVNGNKDHWWRVERGVERHFLKTVDQWLIKQTIKFIKSTHLLWLSLLTAPLFALESHYFAVKYIDVDAKPKIEHDIILL